MIARVRAVRVLVLLVFGGSFAVCAAPAAGQAEQCGGGVSGETGRYRFHVVAIRGVTCGQARRVARRYDWLQAPPDRGSASLHARRTLPASFPAARAGRCVMFELGPRRWKRVGREGLAPRARISSLRLGHDFPRTVIRARRASETSGEEHGDNHRRKTR
jgi:hypothetical protein